MDGSEQPLLVHGQASGVLERGELAPFLYRLGHAQVTGVLDLVPSPGGAEVLWIERGCVVTSAADPMGRVTARRLGGLAGMRRVRYCFAAGGHTGAGSPQPGGPTLHLSGWARSHLEAQLDAQCGRVLLEELTGPRLSIAPGCAPPVAVCDEIDLRIVAAMQAPRPLHEIWRLARTSRFRLLSFLYFLRSVRALHFSGGPQAAAGPAGPGAIGPAGAGVTSSPDHARQRPPTLDPHQDTQRQAERLLGVGPGADRATIRRAYRRRARALHPDLQPQLSELQRRRLEHALAVVTEAYEQLLAAAPETSKPARKP
ncbi:MAG TPA: DnaJ domain-containing protein [Haliangium sp.]|nr:DnaJ domain-containing protein [Haliangium sp.]